MQDPFELTRNVAAVVKDDFVDCMVDTFDAAYRKLKKEQTISEV